MPLSLFALFLVFCESYQLCFAALQSESEKTVFGYRCLIFNFCSCNLWAPKITLFFLKNKMCMNVSANMLVTRFETNAAICCSLMKKLPNLAQSIIYHVKMACIPLYGSSKHYTDSLKFFVVFTLRQGPTPLRAIASKFPEIDLHQNLRFRSITYVYVCEIMHSLQGGLLQNFCSCLLLTCFPRSFVLQIFTHGIHMRF